MKQFYSNKLLISSAQEYHNPVHQRGQRGNSGNHVRHGSPFQCILGHLMLAGRNNAPRFNPCQCPAAGIKLYRKRNEGKKCKHGIAANNYQ